MPNYYTCKEVAQMYKAKVITVWSWIRKKAALGNEAMPRGEFSKHRENYRIGRRERPRELGRRKGYAKTILPAQIRAA